ncbi:MAG: methyltransferase [Panacibacter sp.]
MPYQLKLQQYSFKEINTGIYVPDAKEVQEMYLQQKMVNDTTMFPFWSKIWPAAYAMAEFVLTHPYYIKNKKILELGAGLSLPSLVAAKYAASVCCSDYATEAMNIVAKSTLYNDLLNVTTATLDWRQLPDDISTDVLLLSDLNYDPDTFSPLYTIITMFLSKGSSIILTTPQRLSGKPFIESILPFCIQQETIATKEDNTFQDISVFVLRQS